VNGEKTERIFLDIGVIKKKREANEEISVILH
jgi:hypothetical protein